MSLRIGVIGLGRWGPNHVRVFNAVDCCKVVAAADPEEACRKRMAVAYPGTECTSDYRDILAREDIDAAVVSTPIATHYEIVADMLKAGKHVLCEKPLTVLSREAWQLVELARETGRELMVGHVFLFNPGIEYLERLVREDATDPIYYLSAVRTNLGPFRSDVNAAYDLASHDIYIFNSILGQRPVSVSAVGASFLRKPVDDIVFLTLRYPNGVLGQIHVSWLDPKKVRHITIVGESKMLTWDEQAVPGPVLIYDRSVVRDIPYDTFGEFQLLTREGDVVVPRIPAKEPLALQAQAFVNRCLGSDDASGKGSARQGAEVVDILEAAAQSLQGSGGAIDICYGG